jgi:hypothetical protein
LFYKVSVILSLYYSYLSGEISYEKYSKDMRKPTNLVLIFTIVSSAFTITGLLVGVPIKVILIATLDMLYLIILQSRATTAKKQALYGFIWPCPPFFSQHLFYILLLSFSII